MTVTMSSPSAQGPVAQVLRAHEEGHAALLLLGRGLEDLVVDDVDRKLRPFREALRRQFQEREGIVLVTYTLAAGLDWDAGRLEPRDRELVEQVLRGHRLLDSGHDPDQVPRLLRSVHALCRDPGGRCWTSGKPLRFAFLFEHGEHLAPALANGTQTDTQVTAIELMTAIASSLAVRAGGSLVILHAREGLVDPLVAGALYPLRLAQPDAGEKLAFLEAALAVYPKASFAPGLTVETVARLTARTPNRSQERHLRASHRSGVPVTPATLVAEKIRDVEQVSEGTLVSLDTTRVEGVSLQGRNIAVARELLQQCGAALETGDRSAILNVILAGPPGSGKTDLALELARRAQASAFEVVSPKGGIVGETERRARLQRLALTEWTPNVGIIDEISEAMPLERGTFDGDSGASRAVTASLLTLLSDESRRGKSIIVGTTNCPWRISAAMRSRFAFVPVLGPIEADLPAIIIALGKRLAPEAKLDPSQPAIREAASLFFRKGASPREIGRSLRPPITPKSILAAANDLCPASDVESAAFAELWAVKVCSSRALFPWAKDPAGYPYPPHLSGVVSPETGDIDRVELERRIRELEPHANV
jgi:hypothetical protein